MKLHDLRPADGSRQPRTRVGRGIAAGKGKTAGRGTKGQKARAGGSIPPWFEGGQTPLHMRIPKLRGFTNRFKIQYEVVNVGAIGALAERGAFEVDTTTKGAKAGPITINQDILRAVGLVRTLNKPLKVLGAGELSTALFVVADAFTASARSKIEAAGGSVNVLEVPATPLAALGIDEHGAARTPRKPRTAAGRAAAAGEVKARAGRDADAAEAQAEAAAAPAKATAAAPTESETAESETAEPAKASGKGAKRAKAAAETTEAAGDTDQPAATATSEEAEAPSASSEATDSAEATDTAESDESAETETPSGDDA
jgi:large subunit ribosomal protein L15